MWVSNMPSPMYYHTGTRSDLFMGTTQPLDSLWQAADAWTHWKMGTLLAPKAITCDQVVHDEAVHVCSLDM